MSGPFISQTEKKNDPQRERERENKTKTVDVQFDITQMKLNDLKKLQSINNSPPIFII